MVVKSRCRRILGQTLKQAPMIGGQAITKYCPCASLIPAIFRGQFYRLLSETGAK